MDDEFTMIGLAKNSKYQALDEVAVPFFWISTLRRNASVAIFLIRTTRIDPTGGDTR